MSDGASSAGEPSNFNMRNTGWSGKKEGKKGGSGAPATGKQEKKSGGFAFQSPGVGGGVGEGGWRSQPVAFRGKAGGRGGASSPRGGGGGRGARAATANVQVTLDGAGAFGSKDFIPLSNGGGGRAWGQRAGGRWDGGGKHGKQGGDWHGVTGAGQFKSKNVDKGGRGGRGRGRGGRGGRGWRGTF